MEIGFLALTLAKREFQPGETIVGRLMLQLEEPIHGARLVIGVHATEERCVTDGRGQEVHELRTRYRLERQLDGYRSYANQDYDFELTVPGSRPDLDWRVYAQLDIPRKGKLRAGAEITVG